jgi:hypothetical protein
MLSIALIGSGHRVTAARNGTEALEVLRTIGVDAIICDLGPENSSTLDMLMSIQCNGSPLAFIFINEPARTRGAIPDRATESVHPTLDSNDLLLRVVHFVESGRPPLQLADDHQVDFQAHALARWAGAVVPLVNSKTDARTISAWGRSIAVSPGALRNWCRTAGIPARRSLVFGRLLRAVYLAEQGRHKLENVLDVVDRRTLLNLLKCAGFENERTLPSDIKEFVERQRLVRDPAALHEISRLLDQRFGSKVVGATNERSRYGRLV